MTDPCRGATPRVHPKTDLPVGRRLKIVNGRGGMSMLNGETLDIVRVNVKSYTARYQQCFDYRVYPVRGSRMSSRSSSAFREFLRRSEDAE